MGRTTASASAVFAAPPGKPSREALKNSLSRLHWKLSTCEAYKKETNKAHWSAQSSCVLHAELGIAPAQSLQKNVGKDGRVENGMRSLKMKNTKASL